MADVRGYSSGQVHTVLCVKDAKTYGFNKATKASNSGP